MPKERFKAIAAVYVLLIQGDEILLMRRCNTGYCDGQFGLPSGHVDGGECLTDALAREAKEEIGIDIDPARLELKHTRHRNSEDWERLDFFFTLDSWDGQVQNAEPHKCSELRWAPIHDLPTDTIPYIREVCNHICENVPYSDEGWA
ncbi:MAG: NUDIX domain-containing protein [bacterium]